MATTVPLAQLRDGTHAPDLAVPMEPSCWQRLPENLGHRPSGQSDPGNPQLKEHPEGEPRSPSPLRPGDGATRRYTSPLKWPTRLITLALARRSAEAATSAHALPEFFALLGRHVF